MSTQTVTDKLFTFLDNHQDIIQYAKKGYIPKLCQLFKEECGHDTNANWMRKNLYAYRVARHVPIQYCENKYYNSTRKQQAMMTDSSSDDKEK